MLKRILLWLVIIAVIAGLSYYIVVRFLTSDEDRIRNVIDGMIKQPRANRGG